MSTIIEGRQVDQNVDYFRKSRTETVFNEDGHDRDFRVEGAAVENVLVVDAGNDSLHSEAVQLNLGGTVLEKTTQTALVGTATVTAAQLLTKVLDGTPTAAATYTLPTAALLVAALKNPKVGSSFFFVVNNKSAGANTITVAEGTGGTADGTLTVAQNVVRSFLVIITNVTASSEAYFVYGIG